MKDFHLPTDWFGCTGVHLWLKFIHFHESLVFWGIYADVADDQLFQSWYRGASVLQQKKSKFCWPSLLTYNHLSDFSDQKNCLVRSVFQKLRLYCETAGDSCLKMFLLLKTLLWVDLKFLYEVVWLVNFDFQVVFKQLLKAGMTFELGMTLELVEFLV